MNSARLARLLCFAAVVVLLLLPPLFGQTLGTGSIVGLVTDPSGAGVAAAQVEITLRASEGVRRVATSSIGMYSSGPLQPGTYDVRIQARGFSAAHMSLTVQVGNNATGDVKLQAGEPKQAIDVPGGTSVNTQQPTVQSVLNGDLIDAFPINGRNFIDFAQFDPGIQVQDGGVLDAAKNGLSTISFLSQFGRAEKINVDGVEAGDEIVGTTTQNIPAGAIREFQLAQSMLDPSAGVTSSGALNVITRSGGDQIHGEAFGLFRGDEGAASLPGGSSFSRELFGANAGGAIIKDKVFWFADAERPTQSLTAAEPFSYPFNSLGATLNQPYREFDTDERVDWNMRRSTRAFYRFNFFENNDARPYSAASSTQQVRNDNNTLTNTLGFDFNTGAYAHSLRFEYLKLHSDVNDATGGLSGINNPIPGLGINIGAPDNGNCVLSDGGGYCGGPSWIGPQQEIQSDKLARYDGVRVLRNHILRYGVTFNRIDGARTAATSMFPQAGTTSLGASTSPDPTSYAADWVSLGNGIPYSTAHSAFGLPGGGLGPDNRIELYAGDEWKLTSRFTATLGLHYGHDTGRTDTNLGGLPLLNEWGPGYGNKIRNPGSDLAPQAGFAWDAGGNGKTVIRGGAGLFYGNSLWSTLEYDAPARLAQGKFLNTPEACSGGVPAAFAWPTSLPVGSSIAGGAATAVITATGTGALPNFCGGTISAVAPQILALSSAYQAATAGVTGANPAFLGTSLSALNNNGEDLLYPGFRTPRSWQMNLGLQEELRPGTIFSIDYIRDIGERFLIGQDINHSGAARSFNQANAEAARDKAQIANGCPTGSGQATCMINSTFATGVPLGVAGAQAAYSEAGLDSNLQTTGGAPCSYCAFPGTNPITGNTGAVGGVDMLFPQGRSQYAGWQAKLVQHVDKPIRNVKGATFQISYTYSKFVSQLEDQDTINLAADNDNPTRFTGPNALDHKHQLSFGSTFELPWYTKLSLVGHFYSPLAQNIELPELTNGGEIFASDWMGAGLPAGGSPEILPGTQVGQFQRGNTNINTLQRAINSYNHVYSGTVTPAGACLVGNEVPTIDKFTCPGLISGPQVMTPSDMVALGWVLPTVASVAPEASGIPWMKSMDLKAAWPFKLKEGVTIEPSAVVYNVFNFWNAFLPGNLPNASLIPGQNNVLAPNVLGGASKGPGLAPFRADLQSGTFAMGTPREFEFGLRISF